MNQGEALKIAQSSRNELHRLGYTNSDQAYQQAAEMLAEHVLSLEKTIKELSFRTMPGRLRLK